MPKLFLLELISSYRCFQCDFAIALWRSTCAYKLHQHSPAPLPELWFAIWSLCHSNMRSRKQMYPRCAKTTPLYCIDVSKVSLKQQYGEAHLLITSTQSRPSSRVVVCNAKSLSCQCVYTLNVQKLVPRMYFLDAYRCFQCEFAHVLITSPQSRPLFPAAVCNVKCMS